MSTDFSIGAALRRLSPKRPLIITDADEVLLQFVAGLDCFLAERGLFLDLTSYRLHGNIRRIDDHTQVLDVEVTALLDEFRSDLDWLEGVDGAHESLCALGDMANIVVLTNVSPTQASARLRNLRKLGLDLPIVANSGLKGPAVRDLANHASVPAFFIDDIPQHLESAAHHAPEVIRIHLIGDERLKPLLAPSPLAHHYAETWKSAESFIRERLKA